MRYQLSVIQYPSKRWGFVGSVPAVLGKEVKATKNDVMGGRAFRNEHDDIVTIKWPSFGTEQEAREHAASYGFECQ